MHDEDTSHRKCEICSTPIPHSSQAWAHAREFKPGVIPRLRKVITCKSEACMDKVKELER